MKRRYFDYNATAPPIDEVVLRCAEVLSQGASNASSVHADGRRAKAMLEEARRQVAETVKVPARELRFTSGATESIHDFMEGFLNEGDHVVVSPLEHPAVYGALERAKVHITRCEVNREGVVNVDSIVSALKPTTKLVVMMLAQNELGNIYPIREIVDAVSPIPVFMDAVQGFGKVEINLPELGVKGASFSGHKIGGISGCGALWHDPSLVLSSRTLGGPQESGGRGGTENLLGIVAMGVAASQVSTRIEYAQRHQVHRSLLESKLLTLPQSEILGDVAHRLANTTLFRVSGVPGDLIVQWMDMEGFSISTGAACSSGSVEPSPTLLSMGLSHVEAGECVRISMGPETRRDDVELLAERLVNRIHEFTSKRSSS
ncbi:MAG: cysteine desulfurase family protein [Bradymonadia bacterium]